MPMTDEEQRVWRKAKRRFDRACEQMKKCAGRVGIKGRTVLKGIRRWIGWCIGLLWHALITLCVATIVAGWYWDWKTANDQYNSLLRAAYSEAVWNEMGLDFAAGHFRKGNGTQERMDTDAAAALFLNPLVTDALRLYLGLYVRDMRAKNRAFENVSGIFASRCVLPREVGVQILKKVAFGQERAAKIIGKLREELAVRKLEEPLSEVGREDTARHYCVLDDQM